MKNFVSLILLVFTIVANAQYHPTAVEGRRWNQYVYPFMTVWPGMHYQEFRGDTLYKGKTMKKLISIDGNGKFKSLQAIVDEDISTPALTYYYQQSTLYGDSVFLNLSLNSGDSIVIRCGGDTGYYRADSVSNFVDLTNTSRRQHHFSIVVPGNSFGSYRTYFNWTEGFGDSEGIIQYPLPPFCFSDPPPTDLVCIFDSTTTQLYQNPSYTACDRISIAETDFAEPAIFPNPALSFVEIENLNLKEVKTIQVINSGGMVVMELSNPEKVRIDISQLPSGLFSLNVVFKNNDRLVRKFVKAH